MKRHLKWLPLALCSILLLSACDKSPNYVTVGEYKGLTFEKANTEITQDEVDSYINSVLESQAKPVEVKDRAVKDGDIVNIDYRGLLNGEAFEGGTAQAQTLTIGSGQFIPGFEEGLVGAMPGTQKNLDVTFPDPYASPELAGKAVVFEVTVNFIHGEGDPILPELNDEWVAANTSNKTVAEYRDFVMNDLKTQRESEAENIENSTMLDKIIASSTFNEIPEERIQAEVDAANDYYNQYAAMFGMTVPDLLVSFGMDEETFNAENRASAEEYVKQSLVIEEIAAKENITLTTEDKQTYAVEYGFTDYANAVETQDKAVIDAAMLSDKVIKFLRENNTFA